MPGKNGHWSIGTWPASPASCRRPQGTLGWPGKLKTASKLVTHSPLPQIEHPVAGTSGHGAGPAPPIGACGAAVADSTGAPVGGTTGAGLGGPGRSPGVHMQSVIRPGRNGH
jgi:hypothetical protein